MKRMAAGLLIAMAFIFAVQAQAAEAAWQTDAGTVIAKQKHLSITLADRKEHTGKGD